MDNLAFARAQMGISLAFHMAFAAAGVALPLVLVVSDVLYAKTRDPDYLEISRRMAKGTAILFAVGAVSGTVLSFELGLLWPTFMGTYGEVVGLPFALEGFMFFTEAIFLGVYLYGRGKIAPRHHLFAGIAVAVSGMLSAFFVTLVNSWMNDPTGFRLVDGHVVDVDPIAAMFPRPFWHQTSHAILACYQATAFALAAIHAAVLLAHPTSALFKKALGITLAIATVTALIQPVVGHASAQAIAKHEPTKLAAAEGLYETMPRAPLALGGIYDETTGKLRGAIEIPGGLSFLSFNDVDAVVQGLDAVPPDERPPVNAVHWSFDLMVGSGSAMALLGVVAIVLAWRRRGVPTDRWFLKCVVAAGPLGLVALETGWFVTELGRQPWIVRGFMRTADAVTPFSHMTARFWLFAVVYVFLGVTVVFLLWRQLRAAPVAASPDAPPQSHGPHGAGASP